MPHNLFQNIYKHPLIGAQELQQIQKAHQPIAFRKGDFILRKDEIARGYLILQRGVARAFVYDYEGNDITTDFFCEGEIIVQELSLFKHLPSAENIQALTEWGRLFMTEKLFEAKKRSLEMITLPAKERYMQFIKEKPSAIKYAPLKHIATYLGITDTSLSRIRKEVC